MKSCDTSSPDGPPAEGRLKRLIGAAPPPDSLHGSSTGSLPGSLPAHTPSPQGHADQNLHQRDPQFRQITDTLGEVFWQSLPEWQSILYISPAFERIWGRPCADLYAHPTLWIEAILPEDLPPVLSGLQELATSGHYDVEFRIKRPDGQIRWINDRAYATFDAAGRLTLASGVAADITRRKQMEEALKKSEIHFRSLFALSGDAQMLSREYMFIECNEAALRLFGCPSRQDLIGKHPLQFSPAIQPGGEDSQHLLKEHVATAFSHGSHRFAWQHRRLDGSEFPAEVVLSRVEVGGEAVVQCTVRDFSAHQAALAGLRQARETAEAASAGKSALLANLSHALKAPTKALIGMADQLRRGAATPEQLDQLHSVDIAAGHLLQQIDDLLDLSRIESGMFPVEEVDFEVADLMSDLSDALSERATAKGLHLHIVNETPRSRLIGDQRRLMRALLNYASNAIEFAGAGSITIRSHLQDETADRMVLRFEVADTGIGIAAADMDRLFAPFEQITPPTTRTHGGSGLGLTIAKALARSLGGEVGANSTAGVGSTFWLTAALRKSTTGSAQRRKASIDNASGVQRTDELPAKRLLFPDCALTRSDDRTARRDGPHLKAQGNPGLPPHFSGSRPDHSGALGNA